MATPRKENPQPGGRPSSFKQSIADAICLRMISGESLRSICRDDDMPGATTVFAWLRERPEFQKQYARAQLDRADHMAEEILDIADDSRNDTEWRGRDGQEYEVANSEWIARSRVRIDARKWLMGKMNPKKYGDRVALAGDESAPLTIQIVRHGDSNSEN